MSSGHLLLPFALSLSKGCLALCRKEQGFDRLSPSGNLHDASSEMPWMLKQVQHDGVCHA